jgi:hypothetical protein
VNTSASISTALGSDAVIRAGRGGAVVAERAAGWMAPAGADAWQDQNGLPANNLLRALRPADLALLRPGLIRDQVAAGEVLHEPGDEVRTVWFPCGATLLAFKVVLEDGRDTQAALVGREGAVAGIVSRGRLPAYARAEAQFAGPVLRTDVVKLEAAKQASASLGYLFTRYADCMMAQMFQSIACNAAHSIEQRTAKWLLAAMDRTGQARLPLTQAQLGDLLGVGRSYASRMLQQLRQRGLLETGRAAVEITDAAALGRLACGCETAVRRHFDEVLKGVYPDEVETPQG